MKIRLLDYILFFIASVIYFFLQLSVPFGVWNVVSCFILALVWALVLGTVTNIFRMIFRRAK